MMNIDANFNYSPSFLRVIVSGISLILFIIVIPSCVYIYFNDSILISQIIDNLNNFLLTGIIISIVVGLFIDSMERPIIQFIEGYHLQKILPKKMFHKMQTHQYQECIKLIQNRNLLIKEGMTTIRKDVLYNLIFYYYSIYLYYLYHAKLDEDQIKSLLMPTTFGNIFKSIEVYPNWKYGMDGVFFWSRLISNISELERKDLDIQYAFVNMYANMCMIFGFTFFIFEGMAIISIGKIFAIISSCIALFFLIVSVLCYQLLLNSTVIYGNTVRSIFDLHRKELLEKFDLDLMGINKDSDEKVKWKKIKEYLYYPTM